MIWSKVQKNHSQQILSIFGSQQKIVQQQQEEMSELGQLETEKQQKITTRGI